MEFFDCLYECARNTEFVENFDRLAGTHLMEMGSRAPIERMIDEATGRDDSDLNKFIDFVYEYVWCRLI